MTLPTGLAGVTHVSIGGVPDQAETWMTQFPLPRKVSIQPLGRKEICMPAWKHKAQWSSAMYQTYRRYTQTTVTNARYGLFEGAHEDCADLSIRLLIDFAADSGLPLTFRDVSGWRYISKAERAYGPPDAPYDLGHPKTRIMRFKTGDREADGTLIPWFTKDDFYAVVRENIQTKSLWNHNTAVNPTGPDPGDLMMRFGGIHRYHHTALVTSVYPPFALHPQWQNAKVPDFPGPDAAEKQITVTRYFMGTKDDDDRTAYRTADISWHFDYLNSRSDAKRNAELIYFANVAQLRDDGFQFRLYSDTVLENWADWDGLGVPPRRKWDRWAL
jgi:hypothetical protein